jgi:hypothetical protein
MPAMTVFLPCRDAPEAVAAGGSRGPQRMAGRPLFVQKPQTRTQHFPQNRRSRQWKAGGGGLPPPFRNGTRNGTSLMRRMACGTRVTPIVLWSSVLASVDVVVAQVPGTPRLDGQAAAPAVHMAGLDLGFPVAPRLLVTSAVATLRCRTSTALMEWGAGRAVARACRHRDETAATAPVRGSGTHDVEMDTRRPSTRTLHA